MIEVGEFVICGDWDSAPTPQGKLRIIMPPLGHVEGAGWRDVTQAALLALPDYVAPGKTFAEIGAGSGILSVAAKLLGADRCYATELNPDALEAARRVFAANHVDVELIEGTFPSETVDVAVVSISTDFAKQNRHKIKAKTILIVRDDAVVERLDEKGGEL